MTINLDCNASTPLDPRVRETLLQHLGAAFGNPSSVGHSYGMRARHSVELAREQVAHVVAAEPTDVIFTSGATESNNLALGGLAEFGRQSNKRHILTTAIEHKSVLGPLSALHGDDFDVELLPVGPNGRLDPQMVMRHLRDETLVVSVMGANNETGVRQPVAELAELLADRDCFFHVDAAQSFGKDLEALRHPGIDLISATAHKIYGPQGVGALIARGLADKRVPLTPVLHGGGQEGGLRPGTQPTALIAAFGKAAALAVEEADARNAVCAQFRLRLLDVLSLSGLRPRINGDLRHVQPHVLNVTIPHLDADLAVALLTSQVAVSTGAACTHNTSGPSHVLEAMGRAPADLASTLRFSWCRETPEPNWDWLVSTLREAVCEPVEVEVRRGREFLRKVG
ncbi:aminotransferase class V-fold PLP-dependent enzyme [Persicimonas caeni]|uniref:cysteine desulfurase n=1 Tax=Persicimonas caeni TaxID=2292766 RepID=A0A4Y6PSN3_PERCE|nr:aminotransferase class V-fold PLP-dependent enzyme [Persicimonas caeni]QDG51341.1 aminotransferase class V-fold PLP-dependent enzyme [Persicimonas caeni]QED32562.1 aminotransferase class V-fold PLP-dependent enzyme [Persicimonas caeni]